MPSMTDQHEKLGEHFSAPFVLFRLLTPRDKKYHDAVKAYEPYDNLKHPLPDMRDHTVKLVFSNHCWASCADGRSAM
jgi:hypothetical protein